MKGLGGRRVLLTGGASGIGRATALRLAEEGCQVGILDIDHAGAEETARRTARRYGTATLTSPTALRSKRASRPSNRRLARSTSWPTSPVGT